MRSHVDTGAADGAAPGTRREQSRGGEQIFRRNTGAIVHELRREGRDRLSELREPARVRADEVAVEEARFDDGACHPGEHDGVLPGARPQVDVGPLRGFGLARVDHDEFEPGALSLT